MNLYFLVEGKRTEKMVYPAWLAHIVPQLRRVEDPCELDDQCGYYIFSGEGYPSILDVHLKGAIADFNQCGKFHLLVICLDVDGSTPANRSQEVFDRATKLGFPTNQLRVIAQECCIESWFLGNRKAVSPKPNNSELMGFLKFYNVRQDDPELMGTHSNFGARSIFHSQYFRLVAKEKGFQYTKHRPHVVFDRTFLDELIERRRDTEHLPSFGVFLDLCDEIIQRCPK